MNLYMYNDTDAYLFQSPECVSIRKDDRFGKKNPRHVVEIVNHELVRTFVVNEDEYQVALDNMSDTIQGIGGETVEIRYMEIY